MPVARAESSTPSDSTTMSAANLRVAIQRGDQIRYTNLHVTDGPLDLTGLGEIKQSLRCSKCTIDGGVSAPDVTFSKTVDLADVSVEGNVDLSGATFSGALLVRGSGGSGVLGETDFSFARFGSTTAMDGVQFHRPTNFEGASFADDASFAGTDFETMTNFDRTRFSGALDMVGTPPTGAEVGTSGPTFFRGAVFGGPVDFRERVFLDNLSLERVRAASGVSLENTEIRGTLAAESADLGAFTARRATVRTADLSGSHAKSMLLDSVNVGCAIELSRATIDGRASLRNIRFTGGANEGQAAEHCPSHALDISDLSVDQLSMDLSVTDEISGRRDRVRALNQIEHFERTSGSVARANRAHYNALFADSRGKSGFNALFDWVYRTVAGYLVLPWYPLRALLILAFIGTVVRLFLDREDRGRARRRQAARVAAPVGVSAESPDDSRVRRASRQGVTGAGRATVFVMQAITRSVRADFRAPAPAAPADSAPYTRYLRYGGAVLEWLASKLLIVIFLLCLANYNSTLHDLINGVLKQ